MRLYLSLRLNVNSTASNLHFKLLNSHLYFRYNIPQPPQQVTVQSVAEQVEVEQEWARK